MLVLHRTSLVSRMAWVQTVLLDQLNRLLLALLVIGDCRSSLAQKNLK
jgi:hypothetical protein